MTRSDLRRAQVPVRLARLVRLRQLGAPRIIIKNEQIALIMNSRGKRAGHPDSFPLRDRHL